MFRQRLTWLMLAILGIILAAGVALAASRIAGQHIGLSSEPLWAGKQLAPASAGPNGVQTNPPRRRRHRHRRIHQGRFAPASGSGVPTAAAPVAPVVPQAGPAHVPVPAAPVPASTPRGRGDGGGGGGDHGGGGRDD